MDRITGCEHVDRTFSRDSDFDRDFVVGLDCADVEGAAELLRLMKEHGKVHVFEVVG